AKSMNVLPSTSVRVAPRASAATTGKVIESGEATLAFRRARTSRERGPGTSVLSSIERVAAIPPTSVAEGRLGPDVGFPHESLYPGARCLPPAGPLSPPQAWKGYRCRT